MKKKKVEIKGCLECPWFFEKRNLCEYVGKKVEFSDLPYFPDWCPLEDSE